MYLFVQAQDIVGAAGDRAIPPAAHPVRSAESLISPLTQESQLATATSEATTIGQSDSQVAGGAPAQHAIARDPDGAVWAVWPDGAPGTLQCARSADGGVSFQPAGQSEAPAPVWSASIDFDDEGAADMVYVGEAQYVFYRKGDRPQPDSLRWSIRVRLHDVPALASPNAVAFLEGDETRVHAVWSRGEEWSAAYHVPLKVDPERDIWMLTREQVAGPFDGVGQPTPCIELDSGHGLWLAMWAGGDGVRVMHARDRGGRWLWDGGRGLDTGPALEGSVAAAIAGDALVVVHGGADGALHCRAVRAAADGHPGGGAAGASSALDADRSTESGGEGPVVRSSAGTDAAGRVHVFFQTEHGDALHHRALDTSGREWTEPTELLDAPVQSFSCERRGGDEVFVLAAVGATPPYDVVVTGVR